MPSSSYPTSAYTIPRDDNAYWKLEDQHGHEPSRRYIPAQPAPPTSGPSRYDASIQSTAHKYTMSEDRQHSARAKRPRLQPIISGTEGNAQDIGHMGVQGGGTPKIGEPLNKKSITPSRPARTAPPDFPASMSYTSPAPPVATTQPLARALRSLKAILRISNVVSSTSTPSHLSETSDVASWLSPIHQPPHRTIDTAQKHNTEIQRTGHPLVRRLAAIYVPSKSSLDSESSTTIASPDEDGQLGVLRSAVVTGTAGPSSSSSERSLPLPPGNVPRSGGKSTVVIKHQRGNRVPVRPPRVSPMLYDKALPPPPSSPPRISGKSLSDPSASILSESQRDGGILKQHGSNNTSIGATRGDLIPPSSRKARSKGAARFLARSDPNTISSSSNSNSSKRSHIHPADDNATEFVFRVPLYSDELSQGGRQQFQITRHMLDGGTQDITVLADVPPGCKSGTRVKFPGVGNERTPGLYGDVVFVVEQILDERSARLGNGRLAPTETISVPDELNPEVTVNAKTAGASYGIDIPRGIQGVDNGSEQIGRNTDSPVDTVTLHHTEQLVNGTPEDSQPPLPSFTLDQAVGQQVQRDGEEDINSLNTALVGLGGHRIPLEHLEIDESSVIGRGGFGVLMRGKMRDYHSDVAVKRLTSDETRDIRVAKRLVREMKAWSKLKHRNVLSLIGFHLSEALDLALIVCPLQSNGNVKDYLQRVKPSVLERLELALDTLSAIEYLHNFDPPIVHGDIKSVNVLVGDERQALLCDFGLTLAADEVQTGLTTSKGFKGSVRYCSPELVMHEEARRTVFSDMWAWGCLLVEIMNETVPYAQLRNDFQVMFALTNRVPPETKELLIDPINIWSIVQGCWHVEPGLRSTAETSAKDLRLLMASLDISSPDAVLTRESCD
ncbi:hypothetical protein FRB93_008574 [Tulasnella sp. JGI-2019a]|nr:hypothetical protein FRB93_008574 [Tulasnella sp. JGI-2019a]